MAEHLTSPSAKLAAVRKQMAREGLDGFLVTRADRFQGEEVRAEDEYLAWLTGFTGWLVLRLFWRIRLWWRQTAAIRFS